MESFREGNITRYKEGAFPSLIVFSYEATFAEGKLNGPGFLITEEGDRIYGEWKDDELILFIAETEMGTSWGNQKLMVRLSSSTA